MKHSLIFLTAIFIAGCDVTAQIPPPHKVIWEHDGQNVSGFKIYCGQVSNVYTQNLNIPDPAAREVVVTALNLPDGVNYCAMTAYNFVGESVFSAEVQATIMAGDLILAAPSAPTNLRFE